MSSVKLLDKTRKIGQLLHNNDESKVVFNDICDVMKDVLGSDVYVISRKGKLLGVCKNVLNKEVCNLIYPSLGLFIDADLNDRFLQVLSTKENVNLKTLGLDNKSGNLHGAITPIYIAGKRLGTLFVVKPKGEFEIDDIILCEYGATVVGLEITRSVNEEHEEDNRRNTSAHNAVDTLSSTEKKAIRYIFKALDEGEGIVIASKIADKVGITRSVIVNAIRKLESAGVIETRSAGMKGTYIKVLNEVIYNVVD